MCIGTPAANALLLTPHDQVPAFDLFKVPNDAMLQPNSRDGVTERFEDILHDDWLRPARP